MLNRIKVAKHLNMIQGRLCVIERKTEINEIKDECNYLNDLIRNDLDHSRGSLKVKMLPSEKMQEYCDDMANSVEVMGSFNELDADVLRKIDQCESLIEFIRMEC